MSSAKHRFNLRAKARYDRAVARLTPAEDGSFDHDEVAEAIADEVKVDVRVMQLRQAKQDLQLLRHEDDEKEGDGSPFQLNLFGEGRLVDYDPERLVLGSNNRVIAHYRAPLEYKVAERDRATDNLDRAVAMEARKQREVEIFSRWAREELIKGRDRRDLIWGNCVSEVGILRERPDEAA